VTDRQDGLTDHSIAAAFNDAAYYNSCYVKSLSSHSARMAVLISVSLALSGSARHQFTLPDHSYCIARCACLRPSFRWYSLRLCPLSDGQAELAWNYGHETAYSYAACIAVCPGVSAWCAQVKASRQMKLINAPSAASCCQSPVDIFTAYKTPTDIDVLVSRRDFCE